MKTIFVFLITGFEEIEALATVDVLRRAKLDVKTVSLTDDKVVKGSHDIPVIADMMFSDFDSEKAEMLVLPGGTVAYNDHVGVKKELLDFAKKGKMVAAICASPMVLGGLGLLEGKKATAYPGFEQYLTKAVLHTDQAVVIDSNIITGRGPGVTIEFALTLVEQIAGKNVRDEVAKGLLV